MWNDKANELYEQICELNTRIELCEGFRDDITYRAKFGEPMNDLLAAVEMELDSLEIAVEEVSAEHEKAMEKATDEWKADMRAMNIEYERSTK